MCTRNVWGEFRGEIRLGCNGCNTTYEGRYGCNNTECVHEEAQKRTRAPTVLGCNELARLVHSAMLRIALVTSLLRSCSIPDEDRLLDLLVEEVPEGITSADWMIQQLQQGGKGLAPHALLGLIDNS